MKNPDLSKDNRTGKILQIVVGVGDSDRRRETVITFDFYRDP